MTSKSKEWIGNNLSRAQVWSYSPPVTTSAPNWALTVNGKKLTVVSDGTSAGAAKAMLAAWSASQEPEFSEITASVPASGSTQANPQGTGTNKINSIAITDNPTGGSFGLAWGGAIATFVPDPTAAPSVSDSGTAGNPNGAYRYAYSFVAMNPLGEPGETKLSPEAKITVANHGVLVTVPTGPAGTIARKIYRTLAGGASGTEQLVWEIFDNTITKFFDNIADGSLGAAPPSGNTTGIPYNATAQQIQNVLQNLVSIGPGELVCAGSGTAADPWLTQFVNDLGAAPQPDIVCTGWSFSWPTTVPAQTTPQVVVTEIQPGVKSFDVPPADGAHFVLTGAPGVPFYVEQSTVSGSLTPTVEIKTIGDATAVKKKSSVTVSREAATIPSISVTPIAPTITAARIVQGAPAVNEVQRLTFGPNAQSGPGVASTVTLTWSGQTTGAIPFPPQPCAASLNATTGNLNSNNGFVWAVSFVTQYGETEPSQASAIVTPTNQQANLTAIPTGASVVTARKLYRATVSQSGAIGPYQYLATLNDNTTTSYTDNIAQSALGAENPPTTNFAMQGALEALSNVGQGNMKVSVANYPAWSGHYNGNTITYDVEFEGTLGGAQQPLVTADVSGIVILPRLTVIEIRRGAPPANTIQQFGWTQVLGFGMPSGTFELTIPSLNITTGPIPANASADAVQAAIQAASPKTYQKAFAVTSVQSTNLSYLWQIEFKDVLASTDVPPVAMNIAGLTAYQIPVADTLSSTVSTATHGSITGEDEMFSVSLEDGASGGTFALTISNMQQVNGVEKLSPLATVTGIAYNATAADMQTALNAALGGSATNVTGSAGGPWVIEFVGGWGAQQLYLGATSALTLSGMKSGSPPGSNTAGVDPPVVSYTPNLAGGSLSVSPRYEVTAVNANGETTPTPIFANVIPNTASVRLFWNAVPTATCYKVYRSVSSYGPANTLLAQVTGTSYIDANGTATAAMPPATNTAGIAPPTGLTAGTPASGGAVGLANMQTYTWAVTAINANGETTPGAEASATTTATNQTVLLTWNQCPGATGYKVYRILGSNIENIAAINSGNITNFIDSGQPTAVVDTPQVSPPVLQSAFLSLAGAYPLNSAQQPNAAYVVTANNSLGETISSNTLSANAATQDAVQLTWSAVSGATSYNVYRLDSGPTLLATTTALTFIDNFGVAPTATTPPTDTTTFTLSVQSVGNAGVLAAGTYYYRIGDQSSYGSPQVSATVTGSTGSVVLSWKNDAAIPNTIIYRSTTSGSGFEQIATVQTLQPTGNTITFCDSGQSPTTKTPRAYIAPTTFISAERMGGGVLNSFDAPGTTFYYVVTVLFVVGDESGPSNEVSCTVNPYGAVLLTWNTIASTYYNIYRGTSPGGENTLVATIQANANGTTTFIDTGGSNTTATLPTSNTSVISVPSQLSPAAMTSDGAMAAATYYYVVTAFTAAGETTKSNEESIAVVADGVGIVNWSIVPNATGYNIYRGTSPGGENTLVATINNGSATTFYDSGPVNTANSPPGTNTALIAPPTQTAPSARTTGGAMATGTYYYVVTAYTVSGETTASNEESIAVTGPTGSVTINWDADPGADGYKIYRGTSAGGENVLVGTVAGGAAISFTDSDVIATFDCTEVIKGSPPINEVWQITQQYAIGGTYAIDFNGATTAMLAYNATAQQIQSAMQALVTIGPNNCAVSADSPSNGITQIILTFQGALGGLPMPDMTIVSALVGTTAYDVLLTNALGGTFTLQVGGSTAITSDMAYNAAAETVQNDLAALITVGAGNVTVTAGNSSSEWIVSFNTAIAVSVGRPLGNVETVAGSVTDLITYTGPASGTFSLSINNRRTSQLSGTASASDVQAALEQILPGATVVVTGSDGGPWAATLTASLSGLGSDIADGLAVGISLGFVVSLKNAISGTFTLISGDDTDDGKTETSLGIAYNATPEDVATAIAGMSQFSSATVTGQAEGPWTITITPQNVDAPPTLTGNAVFLAGPSGSFDGYPTIYAMAIGPNFFDAPGNWADGSMPSAYLPAPPAVLAVIPTSGGTLALGDTFYYKVTATNANGETNGGTEGSGQTVSPVTLVVNGATGGTFTLGYGGQTTVAIAYNASAATIQSDMQALSSVGASNCTVTGAGTSASPFELVFSGTALTNGRPAALTANISSLTPSPGSSVSIESDVQQSFTLMWAQVPNATGYKIYRGTSAGAENVLLTTITSSDQTVFVDDGTYTTSAATPPANANAWNTAVGDDIFFNNSNVDCLYNIKRSIVNGYSIHGSNGADGYAGLNYLSANSLTIDSTYTGRIGNSRENQLGYTEYRPVQLSIVGPPGGSFNIVIGNGSGNGSSLVCLDTGTCQVAGTVNKTAGATVDPQALLWIGSNASTEWNLFFGSMGIAIYPGQTFDLATIRQAYQSNEANDTTLEIGPGGTVPALYKSGGDTLVHCDVTTLSAKGGTITQDDGTVGTLDIEDATYYSKSTGEITALKVTNDGVFDRSQDSRPLQVGSVSLYAGATFLDPHSSAYTSAPGTLTVNLVECGMQPQDATGATVDLGRNTMLVRTQN